jgi:hypothetical protein
LPPTVCIAEVRAFDAGQGRNRSKIEKAKVQITNKCSPMLFKPELKIVSDQMFIALTSSPYFGNAMLGEVLCE